jgi:hypothetical protein
MAIIWFRASSESRQAPRHDEFASRIAAKIFWRRPSRGRRFRKLQVTTPRQSPCRTMPLQVVKHASRSHQTRPEPSLLQTIHSEMYFYCAASSRLYSRSVVTAHRVADVNDASALSYAANRLIAAGELQPREASRCILLTYR